MDRTKHFGSPTDEELKKINTFSLKSLSAEDVFVFCVTLCDNEIDRDFECFDLDALSKLSTLFTGKTGIFDHSMKAKDQSCRAFETFLEEVDGKTTSTGEGYTRLMAKAYCLNTPENKNLISQIEGGIKKEISVSCSVSESICSICGKDSRTESCEHRGGRFYRKNGRKALCYHTLKNPTDAYEWSFVAVPAQRKAGVTKSFEEMTELFKSEDMITVNRDCYEDIASQLSDLERKSAIADEYIENLKKEIIALSAFSTPLSSKAIRSVTDKMSFEELKGFCGELKANSAPLQLRAEKESEAEGFDNFRI